MGNYYGIKVGENGYSMNVERSDDPNETDTISTMCL